MTHLEHLLLVLISIYTFRNEQVLGDLFENARLKFGLKMPAFHNIFAVKLHPLDITETIHILNLIQSCEKSDGVKSQKHKLNTLLRLQEKREILQHHKIQS